MKKTIEKLSKENLLSPHEFAERLSISRWTVYKMIGDGRIQSIKISRLVRIPASEVQRLIQRGLRPAQGRKRPPVPESEVSNGLE